MYIKPLPENAESSSIKCIISRVDLLKLKTLNAHDDECRVQKITKQI